MGVLEYIGMAVGVSIAVLVAFLSIVTLAPGFAVPKQPITPAERAAWQW
ncbi:MAG: hypothetical protein JSU61_01625 [Fidelibacterota bacterium]|nr:MAG: hypothetical protein JSU61_01625 [Candidatus Neomarinimicrobiota bacterium]